MTNDEAQAAQQEQLNKAYQEYVQKQADLAYEVRRAHQRAQETQREIDQRPRQQYAVIVAVDECGGFSKNGEIPWYYPEDFKWFKAKTAEQICVMGRTTYDDICKRLGDKAKDNVLPNRKCFVVTSRPLELNNATPVASISDVDKHLTEEDLSKTVFFIGGEQIYREGIAKANTAFVTVVNKDFECDRFFPTNYVLKHFDQQQVFQHPGTPDLRFVVFKRK